MLRPALPARGAGRMVGAWPWVGVREHPPSRVAPELAQRNPRLLLRLPGVFLLRLAARRLPAGLFQLPPRLTRLESLWARTLRHHGCHGSAGSSRASTPRKNPREAAWEAWAVTLCRMAAASVSVIRPCSWPRWARRTALARRRALA